MLSTREQHEEGEHPSLNYAKRVEKLSGGWSPVHLPKVMTGDLAEEIGIHISDGTMSQRTVEYAGHAEDDRAYLVYWVSPLLKKVWNISRVKYKADAGTKSIYLRVYSRGVVLFKKKILGLPYGKKKGIRIPKYCLKNRWLVKRVLRGLFDGDGSLSFKSKGGLAHTYPVMSYSSVSKDLLGQLQGLLKKLGFTLPNKLYDMKNGTNILSINGDKNYERWMGLIGFSNPKHLTKVALYERFGLVPPNTGLIDRLKLIRGEVKLSDIYPAKNLRVNSDRTKERKVLEKLSNGETYTEILGSLQTINGRIIKRAFRRLSKMGLVECVEEPPRWEKYRLTQWGINKFYRAETIMKRLREEFHLAI